MLLAILVEIEMKHWVILATSVPWSDCKSTLSQNTVNALLSRDTGVNCESPFSARDPSMKKSGFPQFLSGFDKPVTLLPS